MVVAVAPLPFRARKAFVLDGQQVDPGDVVDVSGLSALRIKQMENGNYGLRVAAEGPDHVQVVRSSEPNDLPSEGSEDAPQQNIEDDGLETALADLDDDLLEIVEEPAAPTAKPAKAARSTKKAK